HQLKGVAGNLALPEVCRLAAELQNAVVEGGDAAGLIAQLRGALATALESIAALASAEQRRGAAVPAPSTAALDTLDTPELLAGLLACLDQDNPDATAPLLEALATRLPADALAPARARLDGFDFRGAEAEVRALAAALPAGAEEA
ncbi:MAG: hypothetical protein ABIQ08_09925, partial [Duganella sp.]